MPKKAPLKGDEGQERLPSDKDEMFCQEIVAGRSQCEAYLNAGFRARNNAVATACAQKVLKRPLIRLRLAHLRAVIDEKYALSEDNIRKRLGIILNANVADYSSWGPGGVTLTDSSKLTREQQLAVEEVSETVTKDGGSVKFKLCSPLKAIELAARIQGLLDSRRENDEDPIAAALDRIAKRMDNVRS